MFTCKSGKHTWLSQSHAARCCDGYARYTLIGHQPSNASSVSTLVDDIQAGYIWIPGPTLLYQHGQPRTLPYAETEAANLGTGQIGRIQQPYLDITAKAATSLGALLAPTWELVKGIKLHSLSPEAYEEGYLSLLRGRYRHHPDDFIKLLTPGQLTTLACFCKPLSFCHRYLAVRALQQIAERHGIPCQYTGELPTHLRRT